MVRDWRTLGLAALAAVAVALTGVAGVHAQTAAKSAKAPAAKKAPDQGQKAADDDDDDEGKLKPTAAKRKKVDPAEAQRTVEAAAKLLEGGKTEQAVQALTTTISAGSLPPGIMAKALLYRGMAYRQQQKPAQAISDLTSAMWLKGGLSPTDRSSALQQRATAYQEAGLTESGQALAPTASKTVTGSTTTHSPSASSASGWGAATTTTSASASESTGQSGSGWNLFGSLFGGGSTSSEPAAEAKATPASTAPLKPTHEPQASSWISGTEVRGTPVRETVRESASDIETGSIHAAAKPEGRFRAQVAMVRSQDEAMAVAAKVKRDYAAVVMGEPEIDQTVVGNMGSFYRVRVGPFSTQSEGQAACSKLRGSGLDCLVVVQ